MTLQDLGDVTKEIVAVLTFIMFATLFGVAVWFVVYG